MDRITTDQIKALTLNMGMDLVGFAPVSRWEHAPFLLSPHAILPTSKSVIVAAIHITDTWTEMGGEPTPQDMGPGGWMDQNALLDRVAYATVRKLNELGYRAIGVASSNIWRYREYEDIPSLFAPDISHMHAAVAAGLGEMVWTGLTSTPEFGPRVRFITIVTDAPLVPSPLYDGPELCDKCMDCVRCCPSFAMKKDMNGKPHKLKIEDKTYTYANKNIWRCAWAEHFSLNLDSKTLDQGHIDEPVIIKEVDSKGVRGHERGVCQKVCIPPHLRNDEPSFGRSDKKLTMNRVNRRYPENMPTLRKMRDDLTAFAINNGAMLVSVRSIQQETDVAEILKTECPGMKSIIAIALPVPLEYFDAVNKNDQYSTKAYQLINPQRIHQLLLKLARQVEDYGYHAASYTRHWWIEPNKKSGYQFVPEKLAEMAGLGTLQNDKFVLFEDERPVVCGAIVTDAVLEDTPETKNIKIPPKPKMLASVKLRRKLENIAEQNLISLFGIAKASTFDTIAEDLRKNIDESQLGQRVFDRSGIPHGSWKSQIEMDDVRIRTASDYVTGANSVIVLGMHYPEELTKNSGKQETQQIGTYGFWTYQTVRELQFAATELALALNAQGYQTYISENMLGIGSMVDSPRGMLPDFRCGAIEGFAAGLGEISPNGGLLTVDHGPHQRQIVIITDAELPADKAFQDVKICKNCGNCISKCPMSANDQEYFDIHVDDIVIKYPKISRHRCDWAKRYSLCKDEGPELIGNITDIKIGHDGPVTIEEIAVACEQKDKVMKHRTCILEPCLNFCKAGNK